MTQRYLHNEEMNKYTKDTCYLTINGRYWPIAPTPPAIEDISSILPPPLEFPLFFDPCSGFSLVLFKPSLQPDDELSWKFPHFFIHVFEICHHLGTV